MAGGAGPWQRCRDMETLELLVGLLAAVAVVVRLAGRTAIPEPVLLVLAGLAVALIPGLPQVELDPQLILALFLPPLLYAGTVQASVHLLRFALWSGVLAGALLSACTVVAVAAVARLLLPGLD